MEKTTVMPIILMAACILLSHCNSHIATADAYGNFESEPVMVSSEINGKIVGMTAERGKTITAGDTLAIIDTASTKLQIQQLKAQMNVVLSKKANIEAQIAVLEEQVRNLQINKERISKLFNEGAATQQQSDDITGQLEVLIRQVKSAETQFGNIRSEMGVIEVQQLIVEQQLDKCFMVSPISGTIMETYASKGEMTTTGKPLVKVADLKTMTLRAYISGAQLHRVKIGGRVLVKIDEGPGHMKEMTGKITWISEEAEFTPKSIQTREERVKLVYALRIDVPNDGTLKSGMPGEMYFTGTQETKGPL